MRSSSGPKGPPGPLRAFDGRWQAHVRAIARIVPVHRNDLAAVLTVLQQENQVSCHWGSGSWGGSPDPAARPEPARDRPLAERFWELLGRLEPDVPV
ncbi:hypothetical protein [Kitasatospora sp. NPDC087314]|uniref:hypothetical protein n=1 Tax=Kitasatospora sp. NPDC087314 TaxID=3364068 RepID=UPI00382F1A9F